MCYKRKDLRNDYCCPFETSIQIPREREGKGTSERSNVTAVSHKQIRKCLSKGRLMRLPCHTLPSFCFTPGALLGLETSFWGRKMRADCWICAKKFILTKFVRSRLKCDVSRHSITRMTDLRSTEIEIFPLNNIVEKPLNNFRHFERSSGNQKYNNIMFKSPLIDTKQLYQSAQILF